jgi:serine/threonine protein kinase
MEYVNDPQHFENRFEVHKKEIKNEEKLKRYARQLLQTLEHIHRLNVVHADLKFPNILLQRPTKEEKENGIQSYIKLCDFGVA